MSIRTRNLLLTAMAFGLAAYAARLGQSQLALACLTFVGGLWLHSGRRPPADPVPMSVAILCCLAFGCDSHARLSLVSQEYAPASPSYGAQALLLADGLEMKPAAAPSCTAGRACIYTLNTDNLIYTKDANDLTLKLHAAQSYRTSANCAGLSSPAAGDVCYDTTIPAPRWYTGAGWSSVPTDSLVVHLAGTETITGDKTASGAWTLSGTDTFTGALICPSTNTPAQTADASIVWDSNDDLLTVGTGAGRKTMLDTNSTQTASGKTFTAPVIADGLTASGSASNDFSSSTGTFKTSTGAGTLGGTTTLAANKNLLCAAGTGAFDFSACSGAFTTPTGTNTLSGNVTIPTGKTATLGAAILWGAVTDRINAAILAIASQATGDIYIADSANTMARLAIGTAGKILNVNSGATAPQWSYAPIVVTGGAATAIAGGATGYLVSPGIAASSATLVRLAMPPVAFTVRNLHCVADTLPGGTDTITCAVKRQVGGSGALSATTVTTPACTDAILTANTCEDTTHSQANAAGTALVIECVQSATSIAAGVTCSFLVTP